jgi:hypothetical protein
MRFVDNPMAAEILCHAAAQLSHLTRAQGPDCHDATSGRLRALPGTPRIRPSTTLWDEVHAHGGRLDWLAVVRRLFTLPSWKVGVVPVGVYVAASAWVLRDILLRLSLSLHGIHGR